MLKLFSLLFFLLSFCSFGEDILPKKLDVYVFEFKPAIYRENNQFKGSWYNKYQELSKLSGIEFNYVEASTSRIEKLLKLNKPGCALNFIKTKNRKEALNFKDAVDYKKPALFKIYKNAQDKRSLTVDKLQKGDFTIVVNSTPAKEVADELKLKTDMIYSINSVMNLLNLKKIDAFIAVEVAVETTEAFQNGQVVVESVLKSLPSGIVCTQETPDAVIQKIKEAATSKWSF